MKIIVHIGLPRAASTTLQRSVFPKSAGFLYLGVGAPSDSKYVVPPELFDGLWKANDERFKNIRDEWKNIISKAIDEASLKKLNIVVSFEGWCRPSGNNDLSVIASRIDDVFDNPIILLILRHPVTWLMSCYSKCAWNRFRKVQSPYDPHKLQPISSVSSYWLAVNSEPNRYFGLTGITPCKVIEAYGNMRIKVIPMELLIKSNFKVLENIFPGWSIPEGISNSLNYSQGIITLKAISIWCKLPSFLKQVTKKIILSKVVALDNTWISKDVKMDVPDTLVNEVLDIYSNGYEIVSKSLSVDTSISNYLMNSSSINKPTDKT